MVLLIFYVSHRNCLVYPKYGIKISDSGSVRALYNADYYTTLEGNRLPVRWMSWESVILVSIRPARDKPVSIKYLVEIFAGRIDFPI